MGDKENKLLVREIVNENKRSYDKIIKYHYPDLVKWINEKTKFLNSNKYKFKTKIYCVLNDITEIHRCENCGKEIENIETMTCGYLNYCSIKCSATSLKTKEKTKQTTIEKYGVDSVLKLKDIREKIKRTNLEKYGVNWIIQCDWVKKKANRAIIEKYGVENSIQLKGIKEKIKQTNLKRYGVEWPIQSDEIKEKMKQTNLERYGVENPCQNDEFRMKMINTKYSKKEAEYLWETEKISY